MATVYDLSNTKAVDAYYNTAKVAAVYANNTRLYLNSELGFNSDSASSGEIKVPSWAVLAAYLVVGGGAGGSMLSNTHDGGYGNNGDFSNGVFMTPKGTDVLYYKIGAGGQAGSSAANKMGGVGGTTEVYIGSAPVATANGGTPTTNNTPQGQNTGWRPLPDRSADYMLMPRKLTYELVAGTSTRRDGAHGGGGYGSDRLSGKGGDGRLRLVFWGGVL